MAQRRGVALLLSGLLALAAALFASPGTATAHNLSVSLACNYQHNPVLSIELS